MHAQRGDEGKELDDRECYVCYSARGVYENRIHMHIYVNVHVHVNTHTHTHTHTLLLLGMLPPASFPQIYTLSSTRNLVLITNSRHITT